MGNTVCNIILELGTNFTINRIIIFDLRDAIFDSSNNKLTFLVQLNINIVSISNKRN